MKTCFKTLKAAGAIAALLLALPNLHAQGLISLNNRAIGVVVSPVYGQEPSDPTIAKTGNTSSGTPAGTTTYGGALLSGTGYTAELWGGPLGTAEGNLSPMGSTTFKTGLNAGYLVTPGSAVAVTGVPEGSQATLQLRVWDNQGGTVTSWAAAQTLATTVASGASATFTSAQLGDGGVITPPPLTGLLSFNIHLTAPSPLHIDWFTADGGGGTCTGSIYTVTGTIGQPEASGPLTGSGYSLTGGFWAIYLVQTPGAPFLNITYADNQAIVSWDASVSGWTLQTNVNLATPTWGNYLGNIVNNSVTNAPPKGNLFFRLKQ